MSKIKVGIIGCGNISNVYFENMKSQFHGLEIVACADIDVERARAKAEQFSIAKGDSVDNILHDPEIQMILNLTIPQAHAKVNLQAVAAGKHVYVEKPFAINRDEARAVLQLAQEKGLRVGSAPDTFLGGGIQTCLQLIQEGAIGIPVAANGFMLGAGHERWHPAPEFYYQSGGGPMFDMGPYYLTALITLLGPIKRVTGSAAISFPERTITSQPKFGQKIHVEVPTHISGVLDFQSGAVGTLITSFDAMGGTQLPNIEIYGSEGTLAVPDPNHFGGIVKIRKKGETQWREIPLTHGFQENARGIGAAEMAQAIRENRPHRANGEMGYHVLDTMIGIHDASREGRHILLESTCQRPAGLSAQTTHL